MKIKNVYPEIEGGFYPVKTEVDREFIVTCEVSGSYNKQPVLKYKKASDKRWNEELMFQTDKNFGASFKPEKSGFYKYTIDGYGKILELVVEERYARYAAWYEMFHRSQGTVPGKSATFADCERRLPDIKKMGFDVIYLPPVHPIGRSHRKGPNNSLDAGPGDPGCPWAVGNEQGGHKSVNPELGTIEDFKHFAAAAKKIGIEIALDIAFNCSPDHPYVKEHPEWFHKRADGSIAYAENPPKKYEDIYPLNFYPPQGKDELWNELKSIFIFWRKLGVTHFRVDNPHTKPTEFWKWVIREVKLECPDTVFLAEAFTNYEKLEELGRVGYSQSYTYFTWRNGKNELIEYFLKLTNSYLKDFLRANLFVNTPDICPPIIQTGGRPAFKMRIALASTLSSVYGMYNGYELLDGNAYPGTEIYADSEKYQYKVWDWDKPGNIKDYIGRLNEIRRKNPALHYYDNLKICSSTNDNIFFYGKKSADNVILVAANLDPHSVQNAKITVPVEDFGISSDCDYTVEELITGKKYVWHGRENYVYIDPQKEPVYIFKIKGAVAVKELQSKNELAIQHAAKFFELSEKSIKQNDVYARRELAELFSKEMMHRIYTGESFDENYAATINKEAKKQGFQSIIHAYITVPGH